MQHHEVFGPMKCLAIDIIAKTIYYGCWRLFFKWKEAFALEDHTAQTDKLVTEVMCRLGIPFRIHTDQGRKFESALFTELCSLLEIIKSRTTRQITLNLTVCWRGSDLSFLCRMDSQYYGDENLQSSFKRQKRYHDVCDR